MVKVNHNPISYSLDIPKNVTLQIAKLREDLGSEWDSTLIEFTLISLKEKGILIISDIINNERTISLNISPQREGEKLSSDETLLLRALKNRRWYL